MPMADDRCDLNLIIEHGVLAVGVRGRYGGDMSHMGIGHVEHEVEWMLSNTQQTQSPQLVSSLPLSFLQNEQD